LLEALFEEFVREHREDTLRRRSACACTGFERFNASTPLAQDHFCPWLRTI
jgi:hypothetical protein